MTEQKTEMFPHRRWMEIAFSALVTAQVLAFTADMQIACKVMALNWLNGAVELGGE